MVIFDLFIFFNRVQSLKQKVIDLVKSEAEQYLGMSMTYSLFEFLKEKFDNLIEEQPEVTIDGDVEKLCISDQTPTQAIAKEKKEQLTKAQKRRQWNR